MEGFNNDFTSSTSVKRSNPSFNGNNENEPNPETASNLKKKSPSKNFMSFTNNTSFPKKKILAERNQTLDVVEQTSLLRSARLDSKVVDFSVAESDDDVEKDCVGKSNLQPYDPIKNYLSPRPKFLRYNPNRRRKIFDENGVKSSNRSFDSGVTSMGLDSCGSNGSCSEEETVEEAMEVIEKENEGEDETEVKGMVEVEDEGEDEEEDETEEEMVEFSEVKGCGLKGVLKFLVVVIALISTTKAICSMNSPNPFLQSLEASWGFNDLYGERWSNVHGVAGLNFSEVGDPMRESGFLVERLKEEEVVFYHHNEVENDETDVIQEADQLQLMETLQENEIAESEMIEIPNLEAEIQVLDQDFTQEVVDQDFTQEVLDQDFTQDEDFTQEVVDQDLTQDEEEQSDANEKNTQMIIDDIETAKEMEDGMEEIDELETTNVGSIGLAGFDLIVAVLIAVSVLILTSFGVIHHSNRMKLKRKPSSPVATMVANKINLVAEKEDIKNPETNSASLVKDPMPKDIRVHAPTVELLGEFEFGAEITRSSFTSTYTKSYTISASAKPTTMSSTQTRSSRMGDSLVNTAEKTVKKPRRKTTEVTPSPVRRSSRIQNRPGIMSP